MRPKLSIVCGSLIALVAATTAFAGDPPTVYVQPNAPGMITVNYTHSGEDDVQSFLIERDGANIAVMYTIDGQWIDSNLLPDTQYAYRVCAIYPDRPDPDDGCSPAIPVRTMPPEQKPAAMDPPAGINVEAADTSIKVWWGATGQYSKILGRIESDTGYVRQVDLENKSNAGYTFQNLQQGVRHRVSLKGCSRTLFGSSCGPWSQPSFATTAARTIDPPEPSQPTIKAKTTDGAPTGVALEFSVSVMQGEGDQFVLYRNQRRLKNISPVGAAASVFGFDGWVGSHMDIPTNLFGREIDYHVCFEGNFPPARVCSEKIHVSLPDPGVITRPDIDPDILIKDMGVVDKRIDGAVVTAPLAGVVLRPNANVLVAAADPNACKSGFVWRLARPEDIVCVSPPAQARTADENHRAAERRDPAGAYGPHTCIAGYVWREAFAGDTVCVTPEARDLVAEENALAASRRQ